MANEGAPVGEPNVGYVARMRAAVARWLAGHLSNEVEIAKDLRWGDQTPPSPENPPSDGNASK